MKISHVVKVVPGAPDVRAQDRAAVIPRGEWLVAVVADGAGNSARGATAADAVLDVVRAAEPPFSAEEFVKLLTGLDDRLEEGGETTAVVVAIGPSLIVGASVGDSIAWLLGSGVDDLSAEQLVKPLIGSGGAKPIGFTRARPAAGTLLLASDGLAKYAKAEVIAETAPSGALDDAARGLVDLVRLKSGTLPDDVGLVIARWG